MDERKRYGKTKLNFLNLNYFIQFSYTYPKTKDPSYNFNFKSKPVLASITIRQLTTIDSDTLSRLRQLVSN